MSEGSPEDPNAKPVLYKLMVNRKHGTRRVLPIFIDSSTGQKGKQVQIITISLNLLHLFIKTKHKVYRQNGNWKNLETNCQYIMPNASTCSFLLGKYFCKIAI